MVVLVAVAQEHQVELLVAQELQDKDLAVHQDIIIHLLIVLVLVVAVVVQVVLQHK